MFNPRLFVYSSVPQLLVQLDNRDWWVLMFQMREEWRFVSTMCGELCVMIVGAVLMPLLCVDNSDTPLKVRTCLGGDNLSCNLQLHQTSKV